MATSSSAILHDYVVSPAWVAMATETFEVGESASALQSYVDRSAGLFVGVVLRIPAATERGRPKYRAATLLLMDSDPTTFQLQDAHGRIINMPDLQPPEAIPESLVRQSIEDGIICAASRLESRPRRGAAFDRQRLPSR